MKKRGFTLIELTVVIAIIGLLALTMTSFDFNKKTDLERRDRFVAKITSMIHSTKNIMISGRGISIGAQIINPDFSHIYINTGSIGVFYYSGSNIIGTGEVLTSPFYGELGYDLSGIYSQSKDGVSQSGSLPVEIIFDTNGNIAFSGGILSSNVILGMDVIYRTSRKTLELDRRFGKVETK